MLIRIILIFMVGFSPAAFAQINDFGMRGLLDIPNARMPSEGTFSATISRKDVADIYAITFQALPRLETSFRYTIFNARELSTVPGVRCVANRFDICDGLRDRSFEAKFKLLTETEYLPQVAVGIRDLLGTGAWGGEYVVASKQLGNLDFTVGLGWGRYAERSITSNPLIEISDRFAVRSADTGLGGRFSLGNYFSGPNVGMFGGFRYSVPKWNLDLMAAYNSDSYARERGFGTIPDADPLSYGLEWEATPGVRLGVSWQQGNQLALRLSAVLDAAAQSPRRPPNRFGAAGSAPAPSRDPEVGERWWPRLVNDAEASGILFKEAQRSADGGLTVRYANQTYQVESDAIARAIAITDLYVPPEFKSLTFTGEALGMPTHSVRIERTVNSLPEVVETKVFERPDYATIFNYPNGAFNVGLNVRTYIFDPDFPLLYQLSAKARGDVSFGGGWYATGSWIQNITSQFDRILRPGGSALPPVRSLATNYLKQGKSGIEDLALIKRGTLGRDVYYQAFGGILEEMFSGVGGAVLWRPSNSRFAVGANVFGVRQREFDKLFGLQDYQTVTGHVSVYWVSPFYDFDVAIHAGRYLAGDTGATLELQKRFANGWSVGAFATLTDVPFEVFGEGSFDKGLIFRFPLDLYSSRNQRGSSRFVLRSINRDGGRMIENWPNRLWEDLRDRHPDRLRNTIDRMTPSRDN